MHTQPIYSDLDQNTALVRALRSLRAEDAEVVAKVVAAFDDCWSVHTDDDYDGYLFMLIEPSDADAEQLPSYLVSGKTSQLELAIVAGDDYRAVGRFDDIYGLAAELATSLVEAARRPGI